MKKYTSIFSLSRAKILSIIKNNPMTISQISKETGLGRTTIYHHIEHLKKNGLVYEKKFNKKQGQPVLITTNKADPIPANIIKMIEDLSSYEKKLKK